MLIGDLIKKKRNELGLTQEELGKLVGVQRAAVNKWESGMVTNLKRSTIANLASLFDVPPSAFIVGEYEEPVLEKSQEDTTQLPVYSSIACGQPCLVQEDIAGYEITPVSWLKGGDYFYIVAKGDSMTGARISEGDLLLIRKQPDVEDGEIAAVFLDGECTLKRVFKDNGRLILQAANQNYPPRVVKKGEVRIIGKLKRVIIKF